MHWDKQSWLPKMLNTLFTRNVHYWIKRRWNYWLKVMKREAFYSWRVAPLQTRYFSSLDAGEALWDRIRSVLGQSQPDDTVLTCFHRVLMLGFSAHEATTETLSSEQKVLMDKLFAQISPPESTLPLVIQHQQKSSLKLIRSFGFWSALLLIGIAVITWGGQTWLNQLLSVM